MAHDTPVITHSADAKAAGQFLDSLRENGVEKHADGTPVKDAKGGVVLDSAASEMIAQASSQNLDGTPCPEKVQVILDQLSEPEGKKFLQMFLDAADGYARNNGVPPTGDVLDNALSQAYSMTRKGANEGGGYESTIVKERYDSVPVATASSESHAPLSLQPNRAVIASLSSMPEAVPWALYLPPDIKSGKSVLAIMSHKAGSPHGDYAEHDSLDGINLGGSYATSRRKHICDVVGGVFTGFFTRAYDAQDHCDQTLVVGGIDGKVQTIRGRGKIYVNGFPVAREASAQGTGDSTITGQVEIAGTTHQIGGIINPDTGKIAGTITPAFAGTPVVLAESFLDFERTPTEDLIPLISVETETYELLANPHRVYTQVSQDARTQLQNELGMDAFSEGILTINKQVLQERHYEALQMGYRLGVHNPATFTFDWAGSGLYKSRADVWRPLGPVLEKLSQQMAEDTFNHGGTHLYVPKNIAAEWSGLPSDMWQSSGIVNRAGAFRLGRLFNKYDVCYSPRVVASTPTGGEILFIGRATNVAQNPIVGDAVSPTMIPLSTDHRFKSGQGYWMRDLIEVNPHMPSSKGFALITVDGL